MFHADEGTDMRKLIVAFCNLVNAPKNDYCLDSSLGIIFLASFMNIGQMFRQPGWEITGTYSRKEGICLAYCVPLFKKEIRLYRSHG